MRIYNYLTYRTYILVSAFGEDPKFAAVMVMGWLFMFNSFSVLYFISTKIDITNFLELYVSIIGGIVMFGGHLLYYFRKGRFTKIIKQYENESKQSLWVGVAIGLLYFVVTLWVAFEITLPQMGGILK